MFRVRNWMSIAVLFSLLLTACSAPTSPAATNSEPAAPVAASAEPPAEPAAEPTAEEVASESAAADGATPEPVEEAQPDVSDAVSDAAANSASLRTFRIVPEQSQASYAVEEELFNRAVRFVNAIGRTNTIEGELALAIEGNQVQLGENSFVVDLRTLTSDSGQRDRRIRDGWLESNTYPWAEFNATEVRNFPADAAEGQDIQFELVGEMTIREVTQPLVFNTTARLENDTLTATAESYLLMRDFGFEPPSVLGMLSVTDGVTVTVELTAQASE
ncbi:MAG: YceI family protein [Litorilinea sp.]